MGVVKLKLTIPWPRQQVYFKISFGYKTLVDIICSKKNDPDFFEYGKERAVTKKAIISKM